MYAAGNLPDHVTRYNHKYEGRWMVVPAPRQGVSWDGILTGITFALSCAGIIVAAVFALQGVSL